jgi:hypothetical protein
MAESLSEKLAGLSRRDQRKAKRGLRQQRGALTSELLEGYEGDYTAAVRGMQSVDNLAKKYGMGRDEFIALNPKLAGKNRVLAGDTIRLSGTPRSIEDAAEAERLRYTANQPAFSEAQLSAQLQKTQRLQELRDLSRGARQLGDIKTARSLGAERKDLRRELQSGNQFGGIASLMGLRNSDRRNDLNFLRRLSGGNLDPKVQRLQEAIAPRTQEQLQGIYAQEMLNAPRPITGTEARPVEQIPIAFNPNFAPQGTLSGFFGAPNLISSHSRPMPFGVLNALRPTPEHLQSRPTPFGVLNAFQGYHNQPTFVPTQTPQQNLYSGLGSFVQQGVGFNAGNLYNQPMAQTLNAQQVGPRGQGSQTTGVQQSGGLL